MVPRSRCIVTTDLKFAADSSLKNLEIVFLDRLNTSADQLSQLVEYWQKQGIVFSCLPTDQYSTVGFLATHEAYALFLFLKNRKFNTIQFADRDGLAYFCLLAKRQGLSFIETKIETSYICSEQITIKSENELIHDFFIEQCSKILSSENICSGLSPLQPLISVCLVTCDRTQLLKQALKSLQLQTYKNFEVIVADNSVLDPLAQQDLGVWPFPLRIVNPQIKTPGGARNLAAAESAGEYLLFMDDDNIADPRELEIFCSAIQNSAADILSCPSQIFQYEADLRNGMNLPYWVPIGPAVPLGINNNVYGDTNFFISRALFVKLSGFREEIFYGEDWEFLARAVLQGFALEVVPERLFYYREHPENLTKRLIELTNQNLRLTPYLTFLPKEIVKFVQVTAAEKSLGKFNSRLVANPTYYDQKVFSGEEVFKLVRKTNQLTASISLSRLRIDTWGNDPWLEVDISDQWDGPIEIDLWLNSSLDQNIQIFWQTIASPEYCELASVTQNVAAGLCRISFRVHHSDRRGPIRIDFANEKCQVELHSLVVKGLLSLKHQQSLRLEGQLREFEAIAPILRPGFFCKGKKIDLSDFDFSEVSLSENLDSFTVTSTSSDPQMILQDFYKYEIQKALVSYRIQADESLQFRLFWSTTKDKNFSEEKVISLNIEKGAHSGQVVIESDDFIERLRIDPLESVGTFRLECLMIESL